MIWFTITLNVKAWPVAFALRAQATCQAFTLSVIVNQITPLTIFGYTIHNVHWWAFQSDKPCTMVHSAHSHTMGNIAQSTLTIITWLYGLYHFMIYSSIGKFWLYVWGELIMCTCAEIINTGCKIQSSHWINPYFNNLNWNKRFLAKFW